MLEFGRAVLIERKLNFIGIIFVRGRIVHPDINMRPIRAELGRIGPVTPMAVGCSIGQRDGADRNIISLVAFIEIFDCQGKMIGGIMHDIIRDYIRTIILRILRRFDALDQRQVRTSGYKNRQNNPTEISDAFRQTHARDYLHTGVSCRRLARNK